MKEDERIGFKLTNLQGRSGNIRGVFLPNYLPENEGGTLYGEWEKKISKAAKRNPPGSTGGQIGKRDGRLARKKSSMGTKTELLGE